MRELLDANSGLSSRVGYTFRFDDYDTDELLEIFMLKMSKAGFTVDDEAREAARSIMRYFHNVENFGNGRFVDRVIQEVIALKACDSSSDLGSETDLANLSTMKAPSALSSQPAPKASDATSYSEPLLPEAVRVNTNRAITPRLKSLESEPHEPELARATPLATICARHIPSIESLCKLTAAAVYQPADVEGAGALRAHRASRGGARPGQSCAYRAHGHRDRDHRARGNGGAWIRAARTRLRPAADGGRHRIAHRRADGGHGCGKAHLQRLFNRKLVRSRPGDRSCSELGGNVGECLPRASSATPTIRARERCARKDLPPHVLEAMNSLLDRGMSRALETLERNEETLRTMASALLENETMTGDGITAIWKKRMARGADANSAGGANGADEAKRIAARRRMRTRDKEQSMASIDTQDLLASLQSALGGKGATAGAQTEGGTEIQRSRMRPRTARRRRRSRRDAARPSAVLRRPAQFIAAFAQIQSAGMAQ